MGSSRWIAAALAATLIVGGMPRSAWADGEVATGGGTRSVSLRAAVDVEAARLAGEKPAPAPRDRAQAARAGGQMMGSPGGGKGMMIVSLVTTVVGHAATYYIFKEMQKQ